MTQNADLLARHQLAFFADPRRLSLQRVSVAGTGTYGYDVRDGNVALVQSAGSVVAQPVNLPPFDRRQIEFVSAVSVSRPMRLHLTAVNAQGVVHPLIVLDVTPDEIQAVRVDLTALRGQMIDLTFRADSMSGTDGEAMWIDPVIELGPR